MQPALSARARAGHSLAELVMAMACGTILLSGLASVMFIAREIAYTPTASTERILAAAAVNQLADEIRAAAWIIERSPTAVEFVVADRNGDGVAERIRYQWSGMPGDPLNRSYNGGAPVAVAEGVEEFLLSYGLDQETASLTPISEGTETLLLSNQSVQGSSDRSINSGLWVSQQINCGALASIPAGATAWNASRISFYGRNSGSTSETLLVQLRSSGNPYYGPTNEAFGTITVPESTISSSSNWNSFSFSSPVRGLALNGRYNLVWASSDSGTACRLSYADTAASGVLESGDMSATWQYMPTRQVFYRLYGTYSIAGTPVSVTRTYLSTVTALLQTADAPHSHIDASISLMNRPELTSAVWRTDFESNPTAIDCDGDGTFDWIKSSGSFNSGSLSGGVWTVDGQLESRPLNNFAGVTHIDVRCRNGAVLRINADRQSGTHGPLIVRVTSNSGVQQLTLSGETAANVEKSLATVERLSSDWVRFRLLIVPQNNIVRLQVHDREIGTYVYPTYGTTTTDRFIALSGTGGQFDYVEARVAN